MANLLVLGGSHSDQPLIEAGLLFGLKVFTTGNQFHHAGHRLAHKYSPGDYAYLDEVLSIAKREAADFIVPGANDFAMLSAAYVAEQLGFPGYDSYSVAQTLHLKHKFKAFAHSINLPVCRSVTVAQKSATSALESVAKLRYPLIIKPVDLTGGKGISRVENPDQLLSAISIAREISHLREVIAEEWFIGSLHSYSTVVEEGQIIFEYFDSEFCLYQEYLVSTSVSICKALPEAQKEVAEATRRVIKELNLKSGVLHCQFLASDHEVRILEYTRRMSGDLYSEVVQKVRGLRHADLFIASCMGKKLFSLVSPILNTCSFVARHCITAEHNGTFSHLCISDEIRPKILSITLAKPFGSRVDDTGRSKVAVVIVNFKTQKELIEFKSNCKSHLQCGVEHI
jgi:biotin carboxylase